MHYNNKVFSLCCCCCCCCIQNNKSYFVDKFGEDARKLLKMDYKRFNSVTGEFMGRVGPGLDKTTGSRLLKDYSPWLSGFQANQYAEVIEIPGKATYVCVYVL